MLNTLVDDVERQFTNMFLAFPLFFYIFNEFLALWTAALVETWVDIVFVWIDKLCYLHSKQECLAITFCDTETAQQLWRNLTRLVVCLEQQCCSIGGNAKVVGKHILPVLVVVTTVTVPRVATPYLKPHPVAVDLF